MSVAVHGVPPQIIAVSGEVWAALAGAVVGAVLAAILALLVEEIRRLRARREEREHDLEMLRRMLPLLRAECEQNSALAARYGADIEDPLAPMHFPSAAWEHSRAAFADRAPYEVFVALADAHGFASPYEGVPGASPYRMIPISKRFDAAVEAIARFESDLRAKADGKTR